MPGWDPSLVDPTTTPADALIIRSPGGRTGNLSLENGQVLSFPWKRQQQVAGTRAGNIKVYDDATTEYLNLQAPTLVPSGDLAYMYLAGWSDGTASIGMGNGEVDLFLASGVFTASGGTFYTTGGLVVTGGIASMTSALGYDITLTSDDDILLTADDLITLDAVGEIRLDSDSSILLYNNATTGTDITIQSNRDALIFGDRDVLVTPTTGDFSVNAGDAINLLADGVWLGEGSSATLQALSGGDVNLTATGIGGNINITGVDNVYMTSSGGVVYLTSTTSDITLAASSGTLSVNTVMEAWNTSYTPTLTQSAAVTKTTTRSAYKKIGRTVIWEFLLTCTGSGTASNIITVSLPFTAVANTGIVGSFRLYDATGNLNYPGTAELNSTTTVTGVVAGSNNYIGTAGGGFAAALVSGSSLYGKIIYEATT